MAQIQPKSTGVCQKLRNIIPEWNKFGSEKVGVDQAGVKLVRYRPNMVRLGQKLGPCLTKFGTLGAAKRC